MDENQLQIQINKTIWRTCEKLRNSIQTKNYKQYVAIMLFVKYLSVMYKEEKERLIEQYNGDDERVKRALSRSKIILEDDCTFEYLYQNRNDSNIGAIINYVLEKITILNKEKFLGIFSGADFNSEEVFGKPKEKNEILREVLGEFNNLEIDLKLCKDKKLNILGNAFEYLITGFVENSNKREAGFYVPRQVSNLIAKLVQPKENDRIYDPACGSGALLLKVAEEINSKKFSIYGQEINNSIYNFCRLNMFFSGINDAHIECGDTLSNPLNLQNGQLMKFNIIVSNPPFYLSNWDKGFKGNEIYNRFKYGIPPKNISDYAFIQHMLESLSEDGRMAVVLPNGVLFRGGSEAQIRERILRDNLIDTIIGLPKNLLYGTSIPITIIIFKKRRNRHDVLFIDASRKYQKNKSQNILTKENIEKIIDTYINYKEIEEYSHIATMEEIEENKYNLNIKKYIDIFEKEEVVDIERTREKIVEIEGKIKSLEDELRKSLRELEDI